MSNRVYMGLKKSASGGVGLLAIFVAAGLFATGTARATPYVVNLVQQGNNVVANGSGAFDLAGLTKGANFQFPGGELRAGFGILATGATPAPNVVTRYRGLAGSTNFGATVPLVHADSTSGDAVFLQLFANNLYLPTDYVSGNDLTSSATFDGTSLADLGIAAGTYTWTWGSTAEQSFTIIAQTYHAAVPEPSAWAFFGLGALGLLCFDLTRRRKFPRGMTHA